VSKLRAGVIGLGVGERHVASYRSIPECEVTVVCDIDAARLGEVADRHGVGRRATDYREVTEAEDVDVVSICSYDDAHAEQAISALEHGKHVMVEKPVVLTPEDGTRVAAAQAASGRILTSNLILRASPRFVELRERIRAGDLGDIFYLEGDYVHQILWKLTEGWRGRMETYSVVYGGGIHLIDLMRWLIGSEVVEVTGMGNKILTRGTDYRFHDTAVNLLRFDNGALAKTMTTLGPQHPKFHRLDVYGTKATFLNDLPDAKLYTGDQASDLARVATPYPGMAKGDLLPEFVRAVREGTEPVVSTADVFAVMAICFAAEESIRTGSTIRVEGS
jgi:UDP-N-acetyl-2-amino-2-deoxyglucuronate dehydrogenase